MLGGYMGKVLDVDLSSRSIKEYSLPDRMVELYVGNKGLGARILYELLPPATDPLNEKNILIVTTAPLTGTGAPSSNRFNITTRSPLTGTILSSNCGGNFGIHLKKAGYDALIIRGKAQGPTHLSIEENRAVLIDAAELWGMDTEKVQDHLPEKTGKLVIGPAGENLVKFACIVCQDRVAGRGGVGAVMGSKNLKAITACGTLKPSPTRADKFKESIKGWRELSRSHPATGEQLPRYGTAVNVNICSATHTLPTRNFKYGHFDQADEVSGETLAEKHLIKNIGCVGCPIACGRQVKYKDKIIKGPEYETIGLLGPNLYIADLQEIIEWNYLADLYGIDTISLGGTLSFVMEAGEKGLIKTDLAFGRTSNISKTIEDIAYRRGFGDEMAEGARYLSDKYGGREFAMHAKGLELASYEPRGAVGHGLGYAISSRGGCHIGGGYGVYLEANGPVTVDPLTDKGKAGLVTLNQNTLEAISTIGCCIFTSYMLFPKKLLELNARSPFISRTLKGILGKGGGTIGKALTFPSWTMPINPPFSSFPQFQAHAHCIGQKFTMGEVVTLGKRVVTMERLFNVREGFAAKDDTLPARLTEELQRNDEPGSRVPLSKMLPAFYKLRGWTAAGIPTPETLKKLNIDEELTLL